MARRRHSLRFMAHGNTTFLTGMHPGLSLRNYPYLVTSHDHSPYHTANRAIIWPQRGCSGHLQYVVDYRSMCPTTIMSTIPCAMLRLQPLHLFLVPGNAQHLLRLHSSEPAVPSVTRRDANHSPCRTEQHCQQRSTTLSIAFLSPSHLLRNSTTAMVVHTSESPSGDSGALRMQRYRSLPIAHSAFPLAAVDEVAPANIRYR